MGILTHTKNLGLGVEVEAKKNQSPGLQINNYKYSR